jgi:hypothetical protein
MQIAGMQIAERLFARAALGILEVRLALLALLALGLADNESAAALVFGSIQLIFVHEFLRP